MDDFYKILLLALASLAGVLTSLGLGLFQRWRIAKKRARWQLEEQERVDEFQKQVSELSGGRDG